MGFGFDPTTQMRVLGAAQLPLRVHVYKHSMPTPSTLNIAEWDGVPERPASLVSVSGRKWILDGTPLDGFVHTRAAQQSRPAWHGASFVAPNVFAAFPMGLNSDGVSRSPLVGIRGALAFPGGHCLDARGARSPQHARVGVCGVR